MNELIIIRQATKDDCTLLQKIIKEVVIDIPYYNDLAKKTEVLKFQINSLVEKIMNDQYSIIVATSGSSNIIGFCMTRFDDYVIWLEWFGVVKSHRGKGIANLLLQELDKTILIRECHKIWCDCRTSNKASIHILSHHGYKQLVTISNHWYKQDFILWEKVIEQ